MGQSPKFNYVAYEIKGNDACSNMVANILVISEVKPEAAHYQHCFQMRLQIVNIQNLRLLLSGAVRALDKSVIQISYYSAKNISCGYSKELSQ